VDQKPVIAFAARREAGAQHIKTRAMLVAVRCRTNAHPFSLTELPRSPLLLTGSGTACGDLIEISPLGRDSGGVYAFI
jgi:hypothetical protein